MADNNSNPKDNTGASHRRNPSLSRKSARLLSDNAFGRPFPSQAGPSAAVPVDAQRGPDGPPANRTDIRAALDMQFRQLNEFESGYRAPRVLPDHEVLASIQDERQHSTLRQSMSPLSPGWHDAVPAVKEAPGASAVQTEREREASERVAGTEMPPDDDPRTPLEESDSSLSADHLQFAALLSDLMARNKPWEFTFARIEALFRERSQAVKRRDVFFCAPRAERCVRDSEFFAWLCATYDHAAAMRSQGLSVTERFKRLPHYFLICDCLASLCASCGAFDHSVKVMNAGLDFMVECVADGISFSNVQISAAWGRLRHLVRLCPSLSDKGAVIFYENKAASLYSQWVVRGGKSDADPEIYLCRQIKVDLLRVRSRRFEKWGNILWMYLAYFLVLFLMVWCGVNSGCPGVPQEVTVAQGSFTVVPPYFTRLPLLPRCSSFCPRSTECTCGNGKLICDANANPNNPAVGSKCVCLEPVCDACNICGTARWLFRNYVFEIFLFATFLDIAIMAFSIMLTRYPDPPLDGDPAIDEKFFKRRVKALQNCALLIAHYGPRATIEATLKYALQMFPPDKIYVGHNGPSDAPYDQKGKEMDTFLCTREVSDWYREVSGDPNAPNINYCWIAEGNKPASFFEAALFGSREKYVCIMDNDCLLQKDLDVPMHIMEDKKSVVAMGFVVRASNIWKADNTRNWLPSYQDLEYKKAGMSKMLQAKMGSTLFAHGAISCWRRDAMVDVLLRHNGNFHGDDLQMGLILHKFNAAYQMKVIGHVSIPTTTPSHFICFPWNTREAKASGKNILNRILVAPFRCSAWGCPHEEKSLFCQRARSWDVAANRMVLDQLTLFLFYWNRAVMPLKPFLLYELYCCLFDYIRIPLLVFILMSSARVGLFAFYVLMLYAIQFAMYALMELWTFRNRGDLRSGFLIALTYNVYNLCLLLVRIFGLMYNIIFWLPRARNKPKMKNRPQLPGFINGKFISPDASDPPPPEQQDVERFHEDARISPYVRGAKRNEAGDGWVQLQWITDRWVPTHVVSDKSPLNTPPRRKNVSEMENESYFLFFLMVAMAVILGYYATALSYTLLTILVFFFLLMTSAKVAWYD